MSRSEGEAQPASDHEANGVERADGIFENFTARFRRGENLDGQEGFAVGDTAGEGVEIRHGILARQVMFAELTIQGLSAVERCLDTQ